MRRFSQRSHLVTLSEINITPLLDLAFVLLIIFVITTPLLEGGLKLTLPKGGTPDPPRKEDFRSVDVRATGNLYRYQGSDMTLEMVEKALIRERSVNPNIAVYIRADKTTPWDKVFQIQNVCANRGISVSLRSQPPEKR